MKKNITPLIFVFGLLSVSFFHTVEAENCTNKTGYELYNCHLNEDCKSNIWYQTGTTLITLATPPYYEVEQIGKPETLNSYYAYMKKIGVSKNTIDSELGRNIISITGTEKQIYYPIDTFDLARVAYRETMNTIYKCGILNLRLVTGEHILKTDSPDQSAMKKKVVSEAKQIESQIKKYNCRKITSTQSQDPSISDPLLGNITYQYCAYKFYLQSYLVDKYSKDFTSFIVTATDSKVTKQQAADAQASVDATLGKISDTKKLTAYFGAKTAQVGQEVAHARGMYNLSLISYSEFERTYEMHLWLTFIFEDYINLRKNLQSLLNPVGQVIYKISNAQSGGN